MALQIVQMETEEYALLLDLLDCAHKLRTRSEAGDYRGALKPGSESPQAQALGTDLSALIKSAKAARPGDS